MSIEEPSSRPRETKASAPKEGLWRQPMMAPKPYAPEDEDADLIAGPSRLASRVRSAAYEHPMGRGGAADFEVALPVGNEALECPDAPTKNGWDAVHPFR